MKVISKKVFSLLLAAVMFVNLCVSFTFSASATTVENVEDSAKKRTYNGESYSVEYNITKIYKETQYVTVKLTNKGEDDIENYALKFPVKGQVSGLWGAQGIRLGDDYLFEATALNRILKAKKSLTFGYINKNGVQSPPQNIELTSARNDVLKNCEVTFKKTLNYYKSSQYEICIKNKGSAPVKMWELGFTSDSEIQTVLNATVKSKENNHYVLKSAVTSQVINPGKSIKIGFRSSKVNTIFDFSLTAIVPISSKILLLGGQKEDKSFSFSWDASVPNGDFDMLVSSDGVNFSTLKVGKDVSEYIFIPQADVKKYYFIVRQTLPNKSYFESNVIQMISGKNGFTMEFVDTDGDQLLDIFEEAVGTDNNKIDTDDDGISDYIEVFVTKSDPLNKDGDGNGVPDGEEDTDGDGLTNLQEMELKTELQTDDTDGDTLKDGEEVNKYHTDPTLSDTDDDGISDSDEVVLGTNPTLADSNGDGVLDGEEKFAQTFSFEVLNKECAVEEIKIAMEGTGNLQKTTTIESLMGIDIMSSNVAGLVGEPFEIKSTSTFNEATLSFKVDVSKLVDTKIENLVFLWYDEKNFCYPVLKTDIDVQNQTVSTKVTHFSRYMIVDRIKWFEVWQWNLNYSGNYRGAHCDTVLAIESSIKGLINDLPIMATSGEYYLNSIDKRKAVATSFIDKMDNDDRTAILSFSETATFASHLTSNKKELLNSLEGVRPRGLVDLYGALQAGIEEFKTYPSNNRKYLVVLVFSYCFIPQSDLEDIIAKAKAEEVIINIVSLNCKMYNPRVMSIASETGGEYFETKTAGEFREAYTTIGVNEDFNDKTDTDHDGLFDAVEIAGMQIGDSSIITTDPRKDDTDGDGLKDGEEMSMDVHIYFLSSPDPKANKYHYVFEMISDPNCNDTDGDGLLDGVAQKVGNRMIAPKDPAPTAYNGPAGMWKRQVDVGTNGRVQTEYIVRPEDDKFTFSFEQGFADFLIKFLLDNKGIVNTEDENIKNTLADIKKTIAKSGNGATVEEMSIAYMQSSKGADILDFIYDENEVAYHSQVKTWQRAFGYNDLYDNAFEIGSKMRKQKFKFFDKNSVEYILWAWKGDYWNLKSGAEIGLYVIDTEMSENAKFKHYDVVDFELPMTLNLYNYYSEDNILNVFSWAPTIPQWWITGFNPIMEPEVEKMLLLGSVDFSGHEELFEGLNNAIKVNQKWKDFIIFDEDEHTVWLIWNGKGIE